MTHPPLDAIRNIGIISHIDAGKTTVSERILYYCGEIHRMGEVHDGLATMDWMPQEQERGITITSTSTSCRWRSWWINLIDTPGHIDFTVEVERSLRVLDGAVAVFSAVEGVQPQSESVWRQADRYRLPRLCLINKMDRVGADHQAVLEQIAERLQARAVLLQLPVGQEGSFSGTVDLLGEQMLSYSETDQGATVEISPIPGEMQGACDAARARVMEAAADFDDTILEDFLEGRPVTGERLTEALARGVRQARIFPVFLGAALRNKGIQPLLDAIGLFLPSPLEVPSPLARDPRGELPDRLLACDPSSPLCALAFKVVADEGRKLTYLRLYSGILRSGQAVLNGRTQTQEKVPRLFRMHAHKREQIDEARAGDIVAAAGLKEVLTGDTLCSPEDPRVLAGLNLPEPVVSLAVEPRGVDDREKLLPALEKLQWEDPTFRVREDGETGQTVLTGMGELHLEVIVDRLSRDFGVQVKTGRPQVVYRETVLRPVRRHEVFQREIDGRMQGGEVLLLLSPLPRGQGVKIRIEEEGNPLPAELLAALRESLSAGCRGGVISGYPLTDIEVQVLEAPFVANLTSETGIRAAAQKGLALAAREAGPTLLEPVMALELVVPTDSAGRVLGSLQQKRGKVEGMASRGSLETIRARIPLAEMFGYMTELRSATKGRGTYTMEFAHFDQAPEETLRRFGFL
ncbi:translation elongation factor 2 (EF-2/EF-G) [Desulfuromonas soudanensis]|uniref:Elongation factor G n=1 Tax=Desulfuromonas soudanensis TaxID=1603606 RepID=A0A0M4CZG5_9BACT|nr:elongation factor G [Desulfuromonas soudanensis]ALC18104.1 translation elongation factor 2 (EF-2/EF-G) [Desulfuromonas soudanensis]